MKLHAPSFWWQKASFPALALWPLSFLYGRIAARRMRGSSAYAPAVPVICIGNVTLGGAGKTPTALALAKAALAMGLKPGFLSRGYGGTVRRPTLVDPGHHTAKDVGDEPLLLASVAPTVVASRRRDGARELERQGIDLIIMDDGFQSAQIRIDCAVVVTDSYKGDGNGFVFPAGPLRAPLAIQFQKLDMLLVVGKGDAAIPMVRRGARMGKPVLTAQLHPLPGPNLRGQRVLAYAGIADPEKFYRTLRELGADIVVARGFGDHQPLSAAAIAELIEEAEAKNLSLVTTAKDQARLRGSRRGGAGQDRAQELLAKSTVIEIEMIFDDPAVPARVIDQAQDRFRRSR
ncbi:MULTISPECIES: tetraacyldisaccharide 4'-kinase [Rhizobium/Agrobacterium group]|uniref:Tetraacyldisaccharide 4'-kinase n=2 Tax=Rhizobium/Agrobacterium group TaxID=227290 RepID=LPXK_ALLAM|nr:MULTISPECIES: tetraacyldisaccharide 4'-kinase [Rhizobium/Agrobacterium group]B9JSD8.1 RecName: Full=Tetraacyldisaccharide 4'-kinase; AltName: Full=Lipid A 4'-kinase [Allorhizobium ampelinum S4]ACM35631.1 tetraacyldisaccharide 4'-kinase [Allorhizobium ampelinum S4]MCF1447880.1 tetraacyldisaccharide 4'-kinase [Allorhizobium ampelinum]MCF1493975.1 tetraacyldisaccharide 4'-kinase [Allorhizobium ampelinum]MUO29426.1 tetraacyldisaccharide 4'-kinase [Agrobacterium vitis]MUO42601.1 tetraacyldisacc